MTAVQLDSQAVTAVAYLMLLGQRREAGHAAGLACDGEAGRVFTLCWAVALWNEAGERAHGIVAWERTLRQALG